MTLLPFEGPDYQIQVKTFVELFQRRMYLSYK